jgi:hypothetical protein
MSSDDKDDLAARQARNEAIRRARDRRTTGTDTPAAEDSTADAGTATTGPNYVEFIDRRMREGEGEKDS